MKGWKGGDRRITGRVRRKCMIAAKSEVFAFSWNRYCAGNGKGLFTGFRIEFSFSYGTGGYGIA